MTDRELLELAAKAAGYDPIRYDDDLDGLILRGIQDEWNPLSEDGDALRLAVKLHLTVIPDELVTEVGHSYSPGPTRREKVVGGQDIYAATRRAIVRAAAEMGRTK